MGPDPGWKMVKEYVQLTRIRHKLVDIGNGKVYIAPEVVSALSITSK